MRVTNQMIGNAVKQNIQKNLQKVSRTQEQLSTGKRILRPSDQPTDISKLMSAKAQKEINQQYEQNIDDGLSYLEAADTALGSVGDMLAQAREFAVQGANDSLSAEDRDALAAQVDKLIDETVDVANTTSAGKYIFAGTDNDTPPFTRNGDEVKYNGNMDRIKREIANLSEHAVDVPSVVDEGEDVPGVFGYFHEEVNGSENVVSNENTRDKNVDNFSSEEHGLFDTLFKLRDLLNEDKGEDIGKFVGDIQDQADNVREKRTMIGARTRHFEAMKDQMSEAEIRLSQTMENIESADIGRLSIDYTEEQLTYRASLASGSRILQTSLLDFLR